MSSYFDSVIDQIQRQRWHGQCSAGSLQVLASVGMHQAILRVDGQVAEAVKLCLLRNLRGVDEPLTAEDAAALEGRFPSSVLTVGRTPVMTAIWTNSMDALRLLRSAGASFTLSCPSDDRNTALHYACVLNRDEMVSYIIPLLPKASLLQRNTHGDTPLHSAARNGHFGLIPLFLSRGEKFYEDDMFVWRQLHKAPSLAEPVESRAAASAETNSGTEIRCDNDEKITSQQTTPRPLSGVDGSTAAASVPPPSEVIRRMLLGRSCLDGSTVVHLIAKLDERGNPERMQSLAATLEQLLDAAHRHHCLTQVLTAVDKSGDTPIVACRTRVAFDVLSARAAGCALRWRWSTAPVSLMRVCDDEDEDLALLLANGVASAEVSVLSPTGETPLHRLVASSAPDSLLLLGSDGLLSSWLDVLASIYPFAPTALPSSTPTPTHDVRFSILSAPDASGYSAWTRLCSSCGVASSLAKEMIAADVARYVITTSARDGEGDLVLAEPQQQQQQGTAPTLPPIGDWLRLPLLAHNTRDRRNVVHHTARLGDAHGMKWLGAHVVGAVLGELQTRLKAVEAASLAEIRRFQAAVVQRKEVMAAAAAAAAGGPDLGSPSVSVSEAKSGSFPSPMQPSVDSGADTPYPALEEESTLRQCVPLLEHATLLVDAMVGTVDHDGFSPLRTAALHDQGLVVDEIVTVVRKCNAFVHDVLAVMLRHALVAAQRRRVLDDAAAQKTKRSASMTAASFASPQLTKTNSFAAGNKSGAAAKRQSFASKDQLMASTSLVEPASSSEVAPPAVVAGTQALEFLRTAGIPQGVLRDAAIVAALLPATPVDGVVESGVLTSQLPLPCGGALCLEYLAEGHSVRRAVTVAHQAAEARAPLALSALIRAAVVPLVLAAEMQGNDHSSAECKAAAAEVRQVAYGVCRRLLNSPGADENQGRNVLHTAVHLGDVRSVDAILRSLAESCSPSSSNRSAVAAAEEVRRTLAHEMIVSSEASSGAYVTTPSLNDEVNLWCTSRSPLAEESSSSRNAAASPLKGIALSALMQFPSALDLLELHDALIGSSLRREACCLPFGATEASLASLGVACHPMVGVEASNLLRIPCRAFLLRETLWRWIPALLHKCPEDANAEMSDPTMGIEAGAGGAEEDSASHMTEQGGGEAAKVAEKKLVVEGLVMSDSVSEVDVTPRPPLAAEDAAAVQGGISV